MIIGKFNFDFKPEFGNASHIRTAGMIALFNKNLKLLKEKEEAKKGVTLLKAELRKQLAEIKNNLAFINKKK